MKNEKRLIDITRAIAAGMAVYPGNPEVSMAAVATIPRNSSNTSLISMGTHTGTHVDSPLHINNNKPGVDRIPLSRCYGRCTVIDTTSVPFGKGIEEKHIKDHGIKKGEIILLKTRNSSLELDRFRKDFIFLANSGAEFLARKKVKAVGIDPTEIHFDVWVAPLQFFKGVGEVLGHKFETLGPRTITIAVSKFLFDA